VELQFRAIAERLEAKDLEFFEFQQRIAPLAELKQQRIEPRLPGLHSPLCKTDGFRPGMGEA
jgi:hypothetical protein